MIIFCFVIFDLFPYGVKVASSLSFWLKAKRSRSGRSAAEEEAAYRARAKWQRARVLLLRRVRGKVRYHPHHYGHFT